MERKIALEKVREKLKANGFSGLYYPGECGCGIEDLAPCGECRMGDGEGEYINGCKPGHKHMDPRPGHVEYGDYVVMAADEPPEEDEFDNYYD